MGLLVWLLSGPGDHRPHFLLIHTYQQSQAGQLVVNRHSTPKQGNWS